ncbi:ParA family protein [Bacillus thuringiensis]|uniref:ParA family protein n=1 Tax=Bacillus thuringiensis TaxID=1428 RepID=UPI0011AA80C9|nr:ParA family protein [Bacillus thuringiensis]
MGKVIAVSAQKGGILKTSMVTNLAGVFAKEGKKVLIIDTDSQSNVLLTFGKNGDKIKNTLYDVLVDGLPVRDVIINVHENIDVVPINDDFNYFDMDVLENREKYPNKFGLLKEAMGNIADEYDFVIIDTPPTLGLIAGNVYTYTEQVLIPFHPEIYTVRSLVKTIQSVNNFKESNPRLKIEAIVPTKVKSVSSMHSENMYNCAQFCTLQDILVTESYIRETVKYSQAVSSQQKPLVLADQDKIKGEKFIEDYVNVAKELNYIG